MAYVEKAAKFGLGIYHTAAPVPGFTPRRAGSRSALEVFVLSGPIAPFVPADAD
jgi:hypothetical protein